MQPETRRQRVALGDLTGQAVQEVLVVSLLEAQEVHQERRLQTLEVLRTQEDSLDSIQQTDRFKERRMQVVPRLLSEVLAQMD
jgi:hypothetical protein